MNEVWQTLVTWNAEQPHVLRAMLTGTLLSSACGVLGCFIVLRRMAFLGDALAHAMLAGVTLGYLLTKWLFGSEANVAAMLIGSVLAGVLTSASISWVSRFGRIKEDAAIGIIYTGVFAAGGMMASYFSRFIHVDLLHFVTGNVLSVSLADLWMIGVVTVVVLSSAILFFRPLQISSFDPVMAAAMGTPVVAIDYLLTGCTSLVVVAGVNLVGVILVVGLLITPAATAYLLTDRLSRMLWLAGALGVTGFWAGYFIAQRLNVAPGSAIVVALTGQFLLALTFAPRHGLLADWIRKRGQVPQAAREDVLGYVLRGGGKSVSVTKLLLQLRLHGEATARAVRVLVNEGLLVRDGEALQLTETGSVEARRLQRAHRLWEAYLEKTGTPREQLHQKADKLEHVHDPQTVGYLDDKLGHPLTDPHGSVIPDAEETTVPDAEFAAALLRPGHSAVVVRIDRTAAQTNLRPGERVTAGERSQSGALWHFLTDEGRTIEADHKVADAIIVRKTS